MYHDSEDAAPAPRAFRAGPRDLHVGRARW